MPVLGSSKDKVTLNFHGKGYYCKISTLSICGSGYIVIGIKKNGNENNQWSLIM